MLQGQARLVPALREARIFPILNPFPYTVLWATPSIWAMTNSWASTVTTLPQ